MIFNASVKIMPLDGLLDPQGKAVMGGLNNLQIVGIKDVRIGKQINLQIDADTKEDAEKIATRAAKELLANQVMEKFEVEIA
jgi:phosphoribosylformylglycinamidine synthase